ncbi:uncharacterized protein M6B38_274375 [Iris pallida]|uniref:Cell division control protein 24 OB domain-containing protein n=1 Tax=Iris pallida TaxID=29817 RepID=A0AAX6I547_IRIPA|nr:uncharacterized protein M6B38_274375 [Iris pallida]
MRIKMRMLCCWVHNFAQIHSQPYHSMLPKLAHHIHFMQGRIESIGPLEAQGSFGCSQRKQITLVDNDGGKLKFNLWGEQVLLANLLSSGSMLAVDRPFIANITDSGIMTSQGVCLEYGSATQLYLVPFVQHEEQVLLASTQIRYQGTRLSCGASQSQGLKVSQVSLPLNSQGSVDFSNYPFRAYVNDLHDKMTGISLYGVVRNIKRETDASETVFSVTIEDLTGAIITKLHFVRYWSLGRLGLGHTIYISGLSCSLNTDKLLELAWFEKDSGTSLVDLSCLPAFLNSSCLHQLSCLSDLSKHNTATNIFNVRLDQIELQHVRSVLCHAPCGRHVNEKSMGIVECCFCHCSSEGELLRSFHLKITLVDESADIFAWCAGQTAAELLQVSPDEFFELPEDEQAMYLYTLQNERFMVAIVNTDQKNRPVLNQNNDPIWEIARAQKCE